MQRSSTVVAVKLPPSIRFTLRSALAVRMPPWNVALLVFWDLYSSESSYPEDVSLTTGVWSSIHSHQSGADPIIGLPHLLRLAENPDQLNWEPFREGVDLHRLYGDGLTGPSAALLRYHECSSVPRHHHHGYEHIIVLAGSQRDEFGIVSAGTLRIHPPGTSHQVMSEAGCLVLAIYEKPVRFE